MIRTILNEEAVYRLIVNKGPITNKKIVWEVYCDNRDLFEGYGYEMEEFVEKKVEELLITMFLSGKITRFSTPNNEFTFYEAVENIK